MHVQYQNQYCDGYVRIHLQHFLNRQLKISYQNNELLAVHLKANIAHTENYTTENKKPRYFAGFVYNKTVYFFAFAAGAAAFAAGAAALPAAAAAGAAALAAGVADSSWRNALVVTTDTIGIRGEFKIS